MGDTKKETTTTEMVQYSIGKRGKLGYGLAAVTANAGKIARHM